MKPLVEPRRPADRGRPRERDDDEAASGPKDAAAFGQHERDLGSVEQLERERHEERVEGRVVEWDRACIRDPELDAVGQPGAPKPCLGVVDHRGRQIQADDAPRGSYSTRQPDEGAARAAAELEDALPCVNAQEAEADGPRPALERIFEPAP